MIRIKIQEESFSKESPKLSESTKEWLDNCNRSGCVFVREEKGKKKPKFIRLDPFDEYIKIYHQDRRNEFKSFISLKGAEIEEKDGEALIKTKEGTVYGFSSFNEAQTKSWSTSLFNNLKLYNEFEKFQSEIMEGYQTDGIGRFKPSPPKNTVIVFSKGDEEDEKEEESSFVAITNAFEKFEIDGRKRLLPSPSARDLKASVELIEEETKELDLEELKDNLNLQVEDINGKMVNFHSLLDPTVPTLIIALSDFGNLFDEENVKKIVRRQSEFYSLGISLVFLGSSNWILAKEFVNKYEFWGKVACDPEGRFMENMREKGRSKRYFLGNSGVNYEERMKSKGFIKDGEAFFDLKKRGGVFLASAKQGLVLHHLNEIVGESYDVDFIVAICKDFVNSNPKENWRHQSDPVIHWQDVKSRRDESLLKADKKYWNVETGRSDVLTSRITDKSLERTENSVPYYAQNFVDFEHSIFTGEIDNRFTAPASSLLQPQEPVILFIRNSVRGSEVLALLWHKDGNSRFLVPPPYSESSQEIIQWIRGTNPSLKNLRVTKSKDSSSLKSAISHFEMDNLQNKISAGCISYNPSQATKNSSTSFRFDQFLQQLEMKKGLPKWLRQKDESTILYKDAHWTFFEGVLVLIHTEDQSEDESQKKKEDVLLNQNVMIVFNESKEAYTPDALLPSQTVIVVKRIEEEKEETKEEEILAYRMAVGSRKGVDPIGPFIPLDSPTFGTFPSFRSFFLSKLINSQRSINASSKKEANQKQRMESIRNLSDSFGAGKSPKSSVRRTQSQMEERKKGERMSYEAKSSSESEPSTMKPQKLSNRTSSFFGMGPMDPRKRTSLSKT